MYCPSSVGAKGTWVKQTSGRRTRGRAVPRHLQEEQEQGDADEWAEKQPHAYRHLPPAEEGDEKIRRKPIDRAAHEFGRRTRPEGFEDAEPDENHGERNAEQQPAVAVSSRLRYGDRFRRRTSSKASRSPPSASMRARGACPRVQKPQTRDPLSPMIIAYRHPVNARAAFAHRPARGGEALPGRAKTGRGAGAQIEKYGDLPHNCSPVPPRGSMTRPKNAVFGTASFLSGKRENAYDHRT